MFSWVGAKYIGKLEERSSWDWEIKKFTTFYLFAIRNNVIERLRINVMDCKNEYVNV